MFVNSSPLSSVVSSKLHAQIFKALLFFITKFSF